MPSISIKVNNKQAVQEGVGSIICGNSDYTITFDFDSEWDSITNKTARFVFQKNGAVQYIDKDFTGATVAVPVLSGVNFVYAGVYSGSEKATTAAKIPCETSVLCYEETTEAMR